MKLIFVEVQESMKFVALEKVALQYTEKQFVKIFITKIYTYNYVVLHSYSLVQPPYRIGCIGNLTTQTMQFVGRIMFNQ